MLSLLSLTLLFLSPHPVHAFSPPAYCPLEEEASLIYPVCDDQAAKLEAARQRAVKAGKPLLVVFGGTWCPWTRAFHEGLQGGDFPSTAEFEVLELPISVRDAAGSITRVPSGSEAVAGLLRAQGLEPRSLKVKLPGLLALDPSDPSKGIFENRAFLRNHPEKDHAYTAESVADFLRAARAKIGPHPAPAADTVPAEDPEPGASAAAR